MKLVYNLWLLSRDERVLRILFITFITLAAFSYLLAGIQAVPNIAGSYDRLRLTPDSRLLPP